MITGQLLLIHLSFLGPCSFGQEGRMPWYKTCIMHMNKEWLPTTLCCMDFSHDPERYLIICIIIPILQMREMKLKDLKQLASSCSVNECQSFKPTPVCCDTKPHLLSTPSWAPHEEKVIPFICR